jgi:small subunit ribosomal protein S7
MAQKNRNKKIMKKHEKNISSLQFLKQTDLTFLKNTYSDDKIIQKLSNFIMQDGKKTKAQHIIKKVFNILAQKTSRPPLKIVQNAIHNVKPVFELRKARISGSTQFIPAVLHLSKQENVAIRWLVQSAKEKKRRTQILNKNYGFEFFLAQELVDAFHLQGTARQKRDEVHKLAEANRTLAFQRWW